ncbi:MAG: hypothetical protein R6U96_04625 [Promethearchaeia archaeon]
MSKENMLQDYLLHLEEKVKKLEKQNRYLKKAGIAVVKFLKNGGARK